MLDYHSLAELVQAASARRISLARLFLTDQAAELGISEEEVLQRLRESWAVMRAAAAGGLEFATRTYSGLSGGDGVRLRQYAQAGSALSGTLGIKALTYAVAIAEHNAAMGKIVAAPTAGACGILPGALMAMQEVRDLDEEMAVLGLVTAGAIGLVIATEASISGAEGGCQAECGTAAAMAAAALVEMAGGSPEMAAQASAIAIKNHLGLVCDPVAGLVEAPCVKRNAGGVISAIAAADMALAGIKSVIPVDEVIAAMREVGAAIPCTLRETAQGGLAVTPTGKAVRERVFGA
jgi:L-serine dehydratase